MSAVAALPGNLPPDPDRLPAAVLAMAVHVVLLVVLVFGVSWQSKAPDAVVVELWTLPPQPVVEQRVEPPRVEPPPKPEPKPEPPPRPAPKPAPPPKAVKPDIVIEKDKKKAPPKKEEELKIQIDLSKQMKDQLAREMEQVRDKPIAKAAPVAPPPAAPVIDPGYANRIRTKIRGNIVVPADMTGNPEAIFDVNQIPDGTVISVKLRKSSGNRSYDEAVERAILKSSPLPPPPRPDQFQRSLELKFRPMD